MRMVVDFGDLDMRIYETQNRNSFFDPFFGSSHIWALLWMEKKG